MNNIDPVRRIREEIEANVAASLVDICLRLLIAATEVELESILQDLDSLALLRPQPEDAIMLLLRRLREETMERLGIIAGVNDWAKDKRSNVRFSYIEPKTWRVTIISDEGEEVLFAEKAWNLEEEDAEILVRPSR
jgi:hypothetical protein